MQFLCKQCVHIQDSSFRGLYGCLCEVPGALGCVYEKLYFTYKNSGAVTPVQPFSGNVKHNTDRYIVSAMKEHLEALFHLEDFG